MSIVNGRLSASVEEPYKPWQWRLSLELSRTSCTELPADAPDEFCFDAGLSDAPQTNTSSECSKQFDCTPQTPGGTTAFAGKLARADLKSRSPGTVRSTAEEPKSEPKNESKNEPEEMEFVRLSKSTGFYLDGKTEDQPVQWLVDTG